MIAEHTPGCAAPQFGHPLVCYLPLVTALAVPYQCPSFDIGNFTFHPMLYSLGRSEEFETFSVVQKSRELPDLGQNIPPSHHLSGLGPGPGGPDSRTTIS